MFLSTAKTALMENCCLLVILVMLVTEKQRILRVLTRLLKQNLCSFNAHNSERATNISLQLQNKNSIFSLTFTSSSLSGYPVLILSFVVAACLCLLLEELIVPVGTKSSLVLKKKCYSLCNSCPRKNFSFLSAKTIS